MSDFLIAPSILSADFAKLGDEVNAVLRAGADVVHFDVMDNHYVPNLTIGPMVCRALRHHGITAPIDVHLMVTPVDELAIAFADAGASFVILGHSERRTGHGETDAVVRAKAGAAFAAGLKVILCCGESAATRESGKAVAFVKKQLKASLPPADGLPAELGERLTVAYEPLWAIGTGTPANTDDIAEMHSVIRSLLIGLLGAEHGPEVRILNGGSVKPDNAAAIFAVPDVGGALVGGASLTADSFMGIALAASEPFDN